MLLRRGNLLVSHLFPSLYGLQGLSKKKDKPIRYPEFAANNSEYFDV